MGASGWGDLARYGGLWGGEGFFFGGEGLVSGVQKDGLRCRIRGMYILNEQIDIHIEFMDWVFGLGFEGMGRRVVSEEYMRILNE